MLKRSFFTNQDASQNTGSHVCCTYSKGLDYSSTFHLKDVGLFHFILLYAVINLDYLML